MEQNHNLGNDFFEKKRYPALRTVAGIYIAYAVIIGLIFLILTFKYLIEEEWLTALSIVIGGSVLVLLFIAFSESIKVFLDIEYNTRRALMSATLEKKTLENKGLEKSRSGFVSEEKVENELSLKIKDSEKVEKLFSLIKGQKGNLFGGGNKNEIIEITMELCVSKECAEDLLLYYKKSFNKDLLEELKSLTTNYSSIKKYLHRFIELGIVKEEYPHDKI
jgi:hypothetical protein